MSKSVFVTYALKDTAGGNGLTRRLTSAIVVLGSYLKGTIEPSRGDVIHGIMLR